MTCCASTIALAAVLALVRVDGPMGPAGALDEHWLWSTAHAIPAETTSDQSGYFSLVEGKNGRLYVGTAKYGSNAYLVEFTPTTKQMKVVVDAMKEIGSTATGFAAQSKIHTRNNVGPSGRIYFGTKQGYPKEGEKRTDYPGGYPMVFDPTTGKTRVYDIPIPNQGIISVTPDESRDIAYISTCSDERPIESAHFLILDLKTGAYRDLLDCQHMYAFIVTDHLGRAYHPIRGGEIARYDPDKAQLERLKHSIDGRDPADDSYLSLPESHPINWEVSPDRKTLYAVAMSGNQLFSYDLVDSAHELKGRSLGPLVLGAQSTDCRAMCVGPDGTVWAGVAATIPNRGSYLHLVSYRPGNTAPTDHGPIAIANPDYTTFTDVEGKPKPFHHGVERLKDGTLIPRYTIMGICAASDGSVYLTTLTPFTLHKLRVPRVAGITTAYFHNSHGDQFFSRLLESDTLDEKGKRTSIELASLFVEQTPENDLSREMAQSHGIPLNKDVASAISNPAGRRPVDGVMLVAEHGHYPESETGQFVYPKRRMFGEVLEELDRGGRVVPVFIDKHLADNWRDASWIYEEAKKRNLPLMAGSSLPVLWRYPPADVPRGAKLKQIVAVSYHRLDTYGFHALEMVQCLAERRLGGETGIAAVRCFVGDAVWDTERAGLYDRRLLDAALGRLKERPIPEGKRIEDLVPEPVLFVIDYCDGLRACIFTLNPAVAEWAVAWSDEETDRIESTLFWTQEARPFAHFTYQVMGIEKMMHTGKPTWPVERTLLTSGALDALLMAKKRGDRMETPWLKLAYASSWDWRQPPAPPPGRPIGER